MRRFASGCWTRLPTACGRGAASSPRRCTTERWLKGVEDLLCGREEPALSRSAAAAGARGLVYSQQTAWYYGDEHADAKVENYSLGWYQALIESRIPFEMVHDRLLDDVHLARGTRR
jgi:hypothetical protein